MESQPQSYLAIDVSKDQLFYDCVQNANHVSNDAKGFARLLKQLRALPQPAAVVCEATGGYERALVRYFQANDIAVCLVSPLRVRRFCQSKGDLAKTDPIDAREIRAYAQTHHPRPLPPANQAREDLVDLMDRRSQLSDTLVREKNRRQKSVLNAPSRASIERMIGVIEQEIAQIDAQIDSLIGGDKDLSILDQALQEVKGVARQTAAALIAYAPEIVNMNRAEAAKLVGLAPLNRDSGKKQGRRYIQGGRAKLRCVLYMAATSAARYNPVIRDYVNGLLKRGKTYKQAIVAAMRKLLLHLQSIMKKHAYALA